MATSSTAAPHNRLLARFAWFAVFYNVLVIVWGALVRASGSGAGCGNHWPLCNGQVIPVSPGFHTIIELTHRMMTGGSVLVVSALLVWTFCTAAKGWKTLYKLAGITLLTSITVSLLVRVFLLVEGPQQNNLAIIAPGVSILISLTIWIFVVWNFDMRSKANAACGFAVTSMLLLLNEAFLGALLVKLGYVTGNDSTGRIVVLSIHLSNTLLLMAALTLTARFLSPAQGDAPHRWAGLQRAPGFGWVVAGLAATIGVGVSGSMAALGDTLFPASSLQAAFAQDFAANSPLLLRLRLVHPACALVTAAFVLWLIARSHQIGPHKLPTQEPYRTFLGHLLLALLVLQFALGIADVLLLTPAWMQLLHLFGADLYWVTLVLLAADTIWPVTPVPLPVAIPSPSASTA